MTRVRPTAPAVAETAPRQRARLALAELARQALRGAEPTPALLEAFDEALPACALGPDRLRVLRRQVGAVRKVLELGGGVAGLVCDLEAAYHAAVRAADGGRR